MRKVRKILIIGVGVVVVSIVGFLLGAGFTPSQLIGTGSTKLPRAYMVQSGSMEPAIKTASVVISIPQDTYIPGDIITFYNNGDKNKLVTHRIDFKLYPEGIDGEVEYMTSGDANDDFDQWRVRNEHIYGKVALSVPYLGYIVDFAKKPYGFILLVIVPATIVVYEELRKFFEEFGKIIKKICKKNSNRQTENKKDRLPQITLLIPLTGAAIVLIGIAGSYFFDIEKSVGNIFQASDNFSTPVVQTIDHPIAQTLVINEFLWNSSCTPNPETKFWLELYNGYDSQINLKDWRFTDNNDNTIQISNSNAYMEPGEYVLIAKSKSTFSSRCYVNLGEVTILNLGGNPDFTPSATGGVIKLEKPVDSTFEVVDRIEYGPEVIDKDPDESIGRAPNGVDTALGDTFAVSDFDIKTSPSPGLPNP